jgi:hypothetical protein
MDTQTGCLKHHNLNCTTCATEQRIAKLEAENESLRKAFKDAPKYAVMVRVQYARHLAETWVTHTVEDTREQADKEAYTLALNGMTYNRVQVVVYHSTEWERLVR